MGVFQAGAERPRDIKAEQSRARLDDANQSTRPNEVTLAELKAQAR